jgi:hypothetical protein
MDTLKAIALTLIVLQAFACGAWFYSLWIKAAPMTEVLVDIDPDAVERLEAMAALQGVTVDELAEGLLRKGLQAPKEGWPFVPPLS